MIERRLFHRGATPVASRGDSVSSQVVMTRGTGTVLDVGDPRVPVVGGEVGGGGEIAVPHPDMTVDGLFFRNPNSPFRFDITENTLPIGAPASIQPYEVVGFHMHQAMLAGELYGGGSSVEFSFLWTPDDPLGTHLPPAYWVHNEMVIFDSMGWGTPPSPFAEWEGFRKFEPGVLSISCTLFGENYGPITYTVEW